MLCAGYCDGTVAAEVTGGTGPFSYAWSTGDTTQWVYGLDPGTYTVVVTDGNGCEATARGSLSEPAPVTFAIALADSCAGSTTAIVEASGGTGELSVRWSTGAVGTSVELPEGQHYVYVEDANGCEVSDVVVVSDGIERITTMNTPATCDTPGTAMLCVVGGRGPFTYLWSDGQTGITAVGLAPGVYAYTAIDGGGCRYDGSTIIEGPEPGACDGCPASAAPLAGGGETEEACDSVTLAADPLDPAGLPAGFAVAYVLFGNPGEVAIDLAEAPVFTVEEAGEYAIRALVYDAATFSPEEVEFGVTTAADLFLRTVGGGGGLCADLATSGAVFAVPECTEPSGCAGGAPARLAGAYACGVGDSAALRLEFASPPSLPPGYAELYLLVDEGNRILAAAPEPAFAVAAEDAGDLAVRSLVYDAAATDLTGFLAGGFGSVNALAARLGPCDLLSPASTPVTAEPFAPDFPDALLPDACAGEAITLNPLGDTVAGYTYRWSPAGLVSDPTAASPTAVLDADTSFTVTIAREGDPAGCSVTKPYAVGVRAGAAVAVGDDVTTCAATEVTLGATAAVPSGVEWSASEDFAEVLATGPSLTVTSGAEAVYFARAGSGRCDEVARATVANRPVGVSLAGGGEVVCGGDEVVLEAGATGRADDFVLFDPSGVSVARDTAAALTFRPATSGRYLLVATNAAGCVDSATTEIEVSSVEASVTAGLAADTAIYPGAEVTLAATASPGAEVSFAADPTIVSVDGEIAVARPRETTVYEVTAVDLNGCPATARTTVEVLDFACAPPYVFVPTGFSPDGDGVNEVFFVDAVNVTDAYYAIYNRWGEEVYESRILGPEGAWDGTFDGEPVDPDVYGVYVRVVCGDGDAFATQGNVTVVR